MLVWLAPGRASINLAGLLMRNRSFSGGRRTHLRKRKTRRSKAQRFLIGNGPPARGGDIRLAGLGDT